MAYKICPICGTRSLANVTLCPTCGTSLTQVQIESNAAKPKRDSPPYDEQFGEADLLESKIPRKTSRIGFVALSAMLIAICGGVSLIPIAALIQREQTGAAPSPTVESMVEPASGTAGSPQPILLATNTPRMVLPTVTPAPPTEPPTPTEGPCEVQVQPGQDLITLAYSCGHRELSVIPLILELNNLDSAESLQAGQMLLIPRPTATPDPNLTPVTDSTASASVGESAGQSQVVADVSTPTPTLFPSATLLPGVAWHIVQPNESLVGIMYQYSTSAEVLSQLNPEVPFSQCDFQFDTGGPRCSVILQPGQQFRVPAPSPTPTLSLTPSGSETATPTPTATFNAPSPLRPTNRSLFARDEIITLRWVASGTLAPGEAYLIRVEDVTSGITYTAETSALSFIVPVEWQGTDERRHEYVWTVSVITSGSPQTARYTTSPQSFAWEGRGQAP